MGEFEGICSTFDLSELQKNENRLFNTRNFPGSEIVVSFPLEMAQIDVLLTYNISGKIAQEMTIFVL